MLKAESPRKWIVVFVGVLVSGIFLWLAIRQTDLDSVAQSLGSARPAFALPFLIFLFIFYWLKSTRWRDLLTGAVTTSAGQLFPIVMIGYAGSAVLPLQLGELFRALIASRQFSLPYALVLGSIGMERIFDLLTVAALLGFVFASGQEIPELLTTAGYVLVFAATFAFLFAALLAFRGLMVIRWLERILGWIPATIMSPIFMQIQNIVRGLEAIRNPRILLRVTINSAIQWLFMGLCIYCSLYALDIHIPIPGIALVLLATVVGISLPAGPGFVGNIQLAFTLALQPFGVDPALALAASIFYHVLAYAAVVVVGFSYLHKMGYGVSQLAREAKSTTA